MENPDISTSFNGRPMESTNFNRYSKINDFLVSERLVKLVSEEALNWGIAIALLLFICTRRNYYISC
jgi:hypothetical protein